jgi:hypothetical protein
MMIVDHHRAKVKERRKYLSAHISLITLVSVSSTLSRATLSGAPRSTWFVTSGALTT